MIGYEPVDLAVELQLVRAIIEDEIEAGELEWRIETLKEKVWNY